MNNQVSLRKLGLLGSLYVSQYIPIMFLNEALPVFMRQQGTSLSMIGLLPILSLPLIFKFLWSPLIDRYSFARWGHYRFWIISFQLLAAVMTALCAFLDIEQNLRTLLVSLFLLFFACSSQDIASDALAISLLKPQERGLGNGVQSAGNYLGAIIGGGGMLIMLSWLGWTASLLTMALIMVVMLLPVMWHKENAKPSYSTAPDHRPRIAYFKVFTDVFRRPGMGRWLIILVLYMMGGYMANVMFRPLLVDLGLSLAQIGLLLGVVSYSAGIVGALVSGVLITFLGRKRSLVIFGFLQAATIAAYLLPAFGINQMPVLYLVAILVQFGFGLSFTALSTVMMDKSRAETAGTDYTLQTSVVYFSTILAAAIGGVIAETFGYQILFLISIAIACLNVITIDRGLHHLEPAVIDRSMQSSRVRT